MGNQWLAKIFSWLTASLDDEAVVNLLRRFLLARTEKMAARQAISLLLRLDQTLYGLESKQAVRLGDGLHVKHRLMNYHAFFVQRVARGERVLDLGCGSGAVSYDLASQAGAWVIGMDHNADLIAQAQSRYQHQGLAFMLGDVVDHPFNQPFDVVVLSNVLEHLENRPAFLQKVIEQTGAKRLLIRVPMFEREWRVPLRRELGLEWRLDTTHYVEYTQEELLQELTASHLTPGHWECRWGEFWLEAHHAS